MSNKITIGYQGDKYSNCEKVAEQFKSNNKLFEDNNVETIPLISSERVAEKLISGEIEYGVVAVKNSIAGYVLETAKILREHKSELIEIDKITLPIHHNLYIKKEIDKSQIEVINGHIQAINQTIIYLRNNFYDIKLNAVEDGASTARKLAEGKISEKNAVVCTEEAGEAYGLKRIASNIEDTADNTTEFYILRKREG